MADLERSIDFYEGLGWTRCLRAAAGVAFFQLGGIALSLYPFADLVRDAGLKEEPLRAWRGIALAHNVRSRGDVDQIIETIARLGGSILNPPEEKSWGGYAGYVADPDGHLWEIAWNPGFAFDQQGNVIIPD
jgi:predicted lactoylglutathione lyase